MQNINTLAGNNPNKIARRQSKDINDMFKPDLTCFKAAASVKIKK